MAELVGGGSKETPEQIAERLGMPVEFVMDADSFNADEFEGVYPDNAQSVRVFIDVINQWRVGARGATGLDFNVLPFVMDVRKVREEDRERVFDDITIMEREALRIFGEMRS